MTRSTDECEMSRSCQSSMFSMPASAFPRSSLERPHICSHLMGFFLCGIAELPFCFFAEPLEDLARLGAREQSDLERLPGDDAAQDARAPRGTCVAVARDDLVRDVRGADARAPRRPSLRRCGSRFAYVPTAPESLPTDGATDGERHDVPRPREFVPPVRELDARATWARRARRAFARSIGVRRCASASFRDRIGQVVERVQDELSGTSRSAPRSSCRGCQMRSCRGGCTARPPRSSLPAS